MTDGAKTLDETQNRLPEELDVPSGPPYAPEDADLRLLLLQW
jgi:hypothetical protein